MGRRGDSRFLSSDPTITNCVIWGNSNTSGESIDGDGTPTVTYSDIEGGFAGDGNIAVDPMYVDADGPDDTPGTEDDDLRHSGGSPCIDAANSNAGKSRPGGFLLRPPCVSVLYIGVRHVQDSDKPPMAS
jgi:hypothetical protein